MAMRSPLSGFPATAGGRPALLRQKVERDPQKPELVLTVRRVGYRFAD